MFRDEFKERYTTIPFAIYGVQHLERVKEIITHQHRELEIICITEGSAVFYIDSREHRMQKGDILIIPPYSLHRGHTSESKPTSYYCICFDTALLCDEELRCSLETKSLSIAGKISSEFDSDNRLMGYIESAFLACEAGEAGWEMAAVGNISLLFAALKGNGFFSQVTATEKSPSFSKDAMQYVIKNYSKNITSRDAACELYIDHSLFCRSFKKNFGSCFTEYIRAYRLEKAKTYLKNTDMSVSEIAYKTGFNDFSYFCKVFKKSLGLSPLAYRKSGG